VLDSELVARDGGGEDSACVAGHTAVRAVTASRAVNALRHSQIACSTAVRAGRAGDSGVRALTALLFCQYDTTTQISTARGAWGGGVNVLLYCSVGYSFWKLATVYGPRHKS